MNSLPTMPSALRLAALACLALFATTACQRKEPPATAAVESQPAAPAATPAPAAAPAPAADDVPEGVLRAYVWQCQDGQKLVMRNLFREKAIAIDFHDGTRRLDQTVSASGARYADSVVVFWTKGSTATLERQGAPAVTCEERRAESLREDAKTARRRLSRARQRTGLDSRGRAGWQAELGDQLGPGSLRFRPGPGGHAGRRRGRLYRAAGR